MMNRRTILAGIFGFAAAPALAASDHPSISFMKQVGKELLAAHRKATVPSFLRVVQRYADVAEISQHALGKYAGSLPSGQRARYQRGVATYMARYFALESHNYTVAKYEVGEATVDSNKDVIVASKIFLITGQSYNVSWRLVWRGGTYKVRDVKGFWLTNFQRSEFTAYLDKRKGDIGQLIVALNG
jgi:phospholipid transport system substrate-binding protein